MTIALIFVMIALLLGTAARAQLAVFRWLYIPASVIGGFLGLAAVQIGLFAPVESNGYAWTTELSQTLYSWPSWLIAVVFAGMLLQRNDGEKADAGQVRRVGKQGLMVWIIVLGETAVGLLATWLIIQQFYPLPNSFGMLIETGFAGGHGTAAAMGDVFANPTVNLVSGRDLGMLMATCGLVYGLVSGILWINLGVRMGWVSKPKTNANELANKTQEKPAATESQSIQPDSTSASWDPFVLHVVLIAFAFAVALLLQGLVLGIADWIDHSRAGDEVLQSKAQKQLASRLTTKSIVDFPLFIYTMFGGWIVRFFVTRWGQGHLIDNQIINRLSAAAMDVLIVAAIASLNIKTIISLLGPFSILFVLGAIWTAICLLVISRHVLPKEHWFQLGLINYGMSTGTTATGFVLLKMVDPKLNSGAAEDYALAVPISAPFIGGGIITIALPLLLLESVHLAIPAVTITAVVAALIVVGKRIT